MKYWVCSFSCYCYLLACKKSGHTMGNPHVGLVKMVVPVFCDDGFLGTVDAYGLLIEADEVDDFLINKVTGIAEETIR